MIEFNVVCTPVDSFPNDKAKPHAISTVELSRAKIGEIKALVRTSPNFNANKYTWPFVRQDAEFTSKDRTGYGYTVKSGMAGTEPTYSTIRIYVVESLKRC